MNNGGNKNMSKQDVIDNGKKILNTLLNETRWEILQEEPNHIVARRTEGDDTKYFFVITQADPRKTIEGTKTKIFEDPRYFGPVVRWRVVKEDEEENNHLWSHWYKLKESKRDIALIKQFLLSKK